MADDRKKLLKKQAAMRRVLLALVPCVAGSIYYFGWRCLAVIAVSCFAAFLAEYSFCRRRGEPVSEALFVTAILYALVMPSTIPFHILVVGIVFAIVFSKEAFGGFGRNIFNPAVAGRCFIYICFPNAMTSTWAPVAEGPLGALGKWSTVTSIDSLTSATPMALMKAGEFVPDSSDLFYGLFLGRMSGTMGVTSALLILIGGLYLFYKKTANRTIIVTLVTAYALLNQVFHWAGVGTVPPALPALLGGGFLFGAFFMATDPVSSASTKQGRIVYAIIIATSAFVIRNFSIFNGGLMFSILLGNMFAPILDQVAKTATRKAKK